MTDDRLAPRLDEGKDKDWFSSMEIRVLAIVAVIGCAAFLIWELTESNPICMFVLAAFAIAPAPKTARTVDAPSIGH